MIAPHHFVAGLFARQEIDVSSLVSAGVSIASSLLPEITSALSVQLTIVPDATRSTKIVSSTSTARPASVTTTSVRSTTAAAFTTSSTAASITSASSSPVSSSLASGSSRNASSKGQSRNAGLIAGIVVGVVVALLLSLLLFCCLRRRKQGKRSVPFFGKHRGSPSTISKDSDFGNPAPAVRSGDLETAERNRANPIVPVPAVVSGRRGASPADNPFDDVNRSPPLHRSTLDPVTEAPEGYTDQYTDGYGWGDAGNASRRGGRLAGVGHQRKPTPDPNSEPGRTHFGLLDYETPPPSRGIGLNNAVSNNERKDPDQDFRDSMSYYGRSWDEVDAVTKRPPPTQHF